VMIGCRELIRSRNSSCLLGGFGRAPVAPATPGGATGLSGCPDAGIGVPNGLFASLCSFDKAASLV